MSLAEEAMGNRVLPPECGSWRTGEVRVLR